MKKLFICIHVISGLLQTIFFPLMPGRCRKYLIKKWAILLLKILCIRVRVCGDMEIFNKRPAFLLVSNHISWLDIHVINSIAPVIFVAKADVLGWPAFGFLAKMLGTIFLKREKISDIKRVINLMKNEILRSEVVAVFPEGTSSDGVHVLPFKSNLFQAAIDAKCDVVPVRISYKEGDSHTVKVAFTGDMTLIDSINNVLSAKDIEAVVSILPPLESIQPRQALSCEAHRLISQVAIQ